MTLSLGLPSTQKCARSTKNDHMEFGSELHICQAQKPEFFPDSQNFTNIYSERPIALTPVLSQRMSGTAPSTQQHEEGRLHISRPMSAPKAAMLPFIAGDAICELCFVVAEDLGSLTSTFIELQYLVTHNCHASGHSDSDHSKGENRALRTDTNVLHLGSRR